MEIESVLREIHNHVENCSSKLIDDIVKSYYRKYKHIPNERDVLEALFNYVITRMGIMKSSHGLETIEDVIDEYMVYGGDQFNESFIRSFDDNYSNQTLNHALLNYMCCCI